MSEPGYYAIIPANVRYDKELTPNAKLLYGEITALCNANGYCWASNSYFSNLYNVSNVTISKWVNQLVKSGYITSEMQYKEGTKEITSRYLRIVNDPIKEKFNTPQRKVNDPIKEKFKDNNTSNITSNNTYKRDSRNSAKAKYADDSPYLKLAELLFERIKTRNPKHKKPNLQSWADDVRKTIELDERSKDDYLNVLEWSQSDFFWQTNILSPAKLRKQFDTLMVQMQSNRNKHNGYKPAVVPQQTKIHKHVIDDEDREAFERLQREGF